MLKKYFILLQQMGKSLMLPVSVLPVAGLLLGIGSARFSDPNTLGWIPEWLATIMKQSGESIFGNLPLIFAISVAIGFTGNDGVAALSATVGFGVFLASLGASSTTLWQIPSESLKSVMGISTLDTGVFGGLIVGCITAYLFNRFFRIKLPQYLGFFGGKRFVPIITGLSCIALGMIMSVIWPPIGNAINSGANIAASGENIPLTAAIYGIVERALIPFGLHHIWNVPFFFQLGSYTDVAGKIITGDIPRFFAGDKTAGILGGAYLFKMFGLPAAAIAMWHSAKPKNRQFIGGIMVSAAFTSFLTGITEPVEFSFLFVAPPLYIIHSFIAGFGNWLFASLGGRMGFTFSQGFIDFFLFNKLGTNVWLIMVFGPLFAALYYFTFRSYIKYFNVKTPGREDEEIVDSLVINSGKNNSLAKDLVLAFGGKSNIEILDSCITRLRVTVKDIERVSQAKLTALGATGVLIVGPNVQVVFGTRSENLKTEMSAYLKTAGSEADLVTIDGSNSEKFGVISSNNTREIVSNIDPEINMSDQIKLTIKALGGANNIRKIDSIALTRLRLELANSNMIDEITLRSIGIKGIMRIPGGKIHLIIGLNAPYYATEMQQQIGQ